MSASVAYCDPLIEDMNNTLQEDVALQAENICKLNYKVQSINRSQDLNKPPPCKIHEEPTMHL